ncbi:MAG: hypothetical protein KKD63_03925 [Proteobacteria bacterium]|nr:hypothetical protein [Desulfobulbaceae bacterium]MBU4152009.1 hypothetical protein [Pseudomonadota bacterium]
MKKRLLVMPVLLGIFSLSSWGALAIGQTPVQEMAQTQEQEQIYGSQLMTEQERAEYRVRMRSVATNEEREQIRLEHHQAMMERAKSQGVTLPAEPPARGGGSGTGGGMGQGRGMGSGGGRGR